MVAAEDRATRARMVDALSQVGLRVRGAASARELVPGVAAPDLLVMHSVELCADDIALLRDLKSAREEMQIVLVCDVLNSRGARRAVDRGVVGLVIADHLEAALAPTVAAVLAGQTAVPRQMRASLDRTSLSFREKQILSMVVQGFTNSQIGGRLYLAESTVKSHLSSAFMKLGVRSRSEAAALILDPDEPVGVAILSIAPPPSPHEYVVADLT